MKNKESFIDGMMYAASLVSGEALPWWKATFGADGNRFEGDQSKQEFLNCLEQMLLGYADLVAVYDKAIDFKKQWGKDVDIVEH